MRNNIIIPLPLITVESLVEEVTCNLSTLLRRKIHKLEMNTRGELKQRGKIKFPNK